MIKLSRLVRWIWLKLNRDRENEIPLKSTVIRACWIKWVDKIISEEVPDRTKEKRTL